MPIVEYIVSGISSYLVIHIVAPFLYCQNKLCRRVFLQSSIIKHQYVLFLDNVGRSSAETMRLPTNIPLFLVSLARRIGAVRWVLLINRRLSSFSITDISPKHVIYGNDDCHGSWRYDVWSSMYCTWHGIVDRVQSTYIKSKSTYSG